MKIPFSVLTLSICLLSCDQQKRSTTMCVPSRDQRINIYKQLNELLTAHESIVESHYPHEQEQQLGKDPDIEKNKTDYDEALKKYKDFSKLDEAECSQTIATKNNISIACVDSIWMEGSNPDENWKNK